MKRHLVAVLLTGWSGGIRLDCIEVDPRNSRRSVRAVKKWMRKRFPDPYRVTRRNVFELRPTR